MDLIHSGVKWHFESVKGVRPLWRAYFQGNFEEWISNYIFMKDQYFCIIFYTHWRTRQNFFVQKNIKLVELSRFAHPYVFTHGRMVYMISRKPVVRHKNKKYAHYIYCIGFRLTEHFFFFFFHFGDNKKIPEFFTAIFGPKLHVIIINNYWTKHNINKTVGQPKDTSP